MIVYSLVNQKGGVSKTTTAAELWAGLNLLGKKALAIDLDSQGNFTYFAGAKMGGKSALGLLTREATAEEAIQDTRLGAFVPSSSALSGADKIIDETGKEYRLREALSELPAGSYDYVIIDTPPELGILTINALTASDFVIIPAQADVFSLQGIEKLSHTIKTVKTYCNRELAIAGLLLTRYNPRTLLAQSITSSMNELARKLGTKVFDTAIREGVAVKEAQLQKMSLSEYAPKSKPAEDYSQFLRELMTAESGEASPSGFSE